MKITLLHYSAPPIVGGVESVLEHHANLMERHAHSVQVIAGRGETFSAKIPLHLAPLADSRHPEILAVKKELDAGIVSKKFDELVRQIEGELKPLLADTEILIAHNVCSLNKNLPLTIALHNLTKQNRKIKLILWHHDLAWTTPRYRDELHKGFPWDALKTAWAGAVQVTISETRAEELSALMHIPHSKIHVIPNGVDIQRFFKLEAQTSAYVEKLDLIKASPLLLLPVRVTSRKNIELALQILAQLRTQFSNAKIIVTGPLGPHNPANLKYFKKLVALREALNLKDAAYFLAELTDEFIPDAVISDFYNLADGLLFPSKEEGFGIPILEAGFSNLPIFCADIPPLKKLGGEFANYFALDEAPSAIAQRIAAYFSVSPTFKLKAEVRKNYTWQGVYETKIAPLLAAK